MKKRIIYKKPKVFAKIAATRKLRQQFSHHFAQLIDFDSNVIETSDFFNNSEKTYYIDSYFEYLDSDLEKENVDHREYGSSFTDQELIKLCNTVIKANAFLQNNKMCHGDIRPCFILYDKLSKQFKLIENLKDN